MAAAGPARPPPRAPSPFALTSTGASPAAGFLKSAARPVDECPARGPVPARGNRSVQPIAKTLVLLKGGERHVYRFTPGSEGLLLASLLEAVRDPRSGLTWRDILPVLVRFRDYIFGAPAYPVAVHCIDAT